MTQSESDAPLRFVVDTNALWWYISRSDRLSPAAAAVFELALVGRAVLIVPAIALAELYYVSVKMGRSYTPADLLNALGAVRGIRLSDLGRTQLELLDRLPEIPEMHDQLIAAEALALGVPVVTRDPVIAASPQVQSIW